MAAKKRTACKYRITKGKAHHCAKTLKSAQRRGRSLAMKSRVVTKIHGPGKGGPWTCVKSGAKAMCLTPKQFKAHRDSFHGRLKKSITKKKASPKKTPKKRASRTVAVQPGQIMTAARWAASQGFTPAQIAAMRRT